MKTEGDLFSLVGKNLIITGASSGIGRQCALQCNKMGATIIIMGRREEKLKEVLSQLNGTRNLIYIQDITKFDELEPLVDDAFLKNGPIDGFIHSAGVELTMPLISMKHTHYEKLFATNVISGFELAKIVSKRKFINPGGASFVFISSIMGIVGDIGLTAYCSSKGALISGVKAMALELASKKIRVNCVSPAYIEDTELTKKMSAHIMAEKKQIKSAMHPLGYGKTEDVANSCIFLLSDASKWVTGTNLILDGGYTAR
jgi:NAD(P)-dependent dehydrogenase (short-subunit alcohol dehydrogenase family)